VIGCLVNKYVPVHAVSDAEVFFRAHAVASMEAPPPYAEALAATAGAAAGASANASAAASDDASADAARGDATATPPPPTDASLAAPADLSLAAPADLSLAAASLAVESCGAGAAAAAIEVAAAVEDVAAVAEADAARPAEPSGSWWGDLGGRSGDEPGTAKTAAVTRSSSWWDSFSFGAAVGEKAADAPPGEATFAAAVHARFGPASGPKVAALLARHGVKPEAPWPPAAEGVGAEGLRAAARRELPEAQAKQLEEWLAELSDAPEEMVPI
jgi:hypothetical protein